MQNLIAVLQQLMHWLAQQKPVDAAANLQATGASDMTSSSDDTTTSSSDDATNSDDNSTTVDASTSGDPSAEIAAALQNLLNLMGSFEKNVATADNNSATTETAAAPVSANDIKSGLGKLVAALQTLPSTTDTNANNNVVAGDAMATTDDTTNSTLTAFSLAAVAGSTTSDKSSSTNTDSKNSGADDWQRLFAAGKDNVQSAALAANGNTGFVPADALQPKADSDAALDTSITALKTSATTASSTASATSSATLPEGLTSSNPYNFASQLSVTRTSSTVATGFASTVDQVILQLNRAAKTGQSDINLQLHPADLGRINVKLSFGTDGSVQGTVVADNPITLDTLLKDVRSLERALQDAGLRADPGSLQFSLGGGQGNGFGQSANNASGNDTSNNLPTDDTGVDAPVAALAQESYYITPGRVNLQV